MKIQNQLFTIIFIMVVSLSLNSCGVARGAGGGRNCDCPKFGSIEHQNAILLASASSDAAHYLD